jgi:hypothetical protein
MLWIAASGLLLASGSALADAERPVGQDFTVRNDAAAKASPAESVDATITDQGSVSPAQDLSKMQPAEARPEQKAPPSPYAVTVDPAHPGGDFPYGG